MTESDPQTVSGPASPTKTVPDTVLLFPDTVLLLLVLLVVLLAHVIAFTPSEPYFNNDETRHVMTGVYVRDLLLDRPAPGEVREHAERYYAQYPALGLIVWPPAFYGIEGVVFLVLGDNFIVARLLVVAFALLACVYLFLLVRRTHDRSTASIATLFFALAPIVFVHSAQVMLEVPTLAWFLMATFHCHRYLDEQRKRDAFLCFLAVALTALTRFDAIFLLPFFLLWLLGARKLKLLGRPAVLLGIIAVLLVVAPVYWLTFSEFGDVHRQSVEGSLDDTGSFFAPKNFIFYPLAVPHQVGWVAVPVLLVGLVGAGKREWRSANWPYLALILGVYLTFSPLAELEYRHTIYWVPALALFAAVGCRQIAAVLAGGPRLTALIVGLVLVGVGVQTWLARGWYVFGYEESAEYVAEHNDETPVCLFDSFLNGGFIYHLRRHDPERRLWVLRGDKLLYGTGGEAGGASEEHVASPKDILELIHRFDPELIVIEDPQVYFKEPLPGPELVRKTLKDNPDRFHLVKEVPLDSNHPIFKGHRLLIYCNTKRNPNRADLLEFRHLGLGRNIRAPIRKE